SERLKSSSRILKTIMPVKVSMYTLVGAVFVLTIVPCSAIDCYFYTHYGVDARGTTIPVQCASSITSCYRTVGSVLTHNPSWKVNYTITAAVGDCGICRASPGVDCRNCTTNLCNGAEPRISLSRWMLLAVSAVATAAFMLA
ncbi:hypothetical protein BOX15_Mlig011901g2, partial [Macrostomum lignano]